MCTRKPKVFSIRWQNGPHWLKMLNMPEWWYLSQIGPELPVDGAPQRREEGAVVAGCCQSTEAYASFYEALVVGGPVSKCPPSSSLAHVPMSWTRSLSRCLRQLVSRCATSAIQLLNQVNYSRKNSLFLTHTVSRVWTGVSLETYGLW